MDSPSSSEEASPFFDFNTLMEKLEEAATIPIDEMQQDSDSDNPHPDKIYMMSLHAIATLIKWAEISKDAGMLGAASTTANQSSTTSSAPAASLRPNEWTEFINAAESKISYDPCTVLDAASRSAAVAQGVDSSVRRQQLINILQARAEVRQEEFIFEAEGQPRRMAVGKNMAVICDERRKLQRQAIYPLGYDRSKEENLWDWNGDYVEHGFGSRVDELEVDSIGRIWAASGSRIKAFGGWAEGELEKEKQGECKLKWTLNCKGYSGAFRVTDEVVFRASTGGKLAFWRKENLVEQQTAWQS
ncbi:hypothetical protein FRC00_013724, partial [Tulasnella sp. 408]